MARIEFRTLPVGRTVSALAVSAFLVLGTASNADAWHYGKRHGPTVGGVLGGAAVGAIIGGAVKGGRGAAVGAGVGAVVGGAASAAARSAPPPPRYGPPPPAYNGGLVYNIQISLTNLGYDPGPVDGVYGRRTADAISAYQYNNQLPVTGQPSPAVYQHMRQSGG